VNRSETDLTKTDGNDLPKHDKSNNETRDSFLLKGCHQYDKQEATEASQ
jgi:hypothetical protein